MIRRAAESTTPLADRLREAAVEEVLPGRNRTKAEVRRLRLDGRAIAVKDYGARPLWIRATLGRWLVRRECDAYEAAEGVVGIPEFLGRIGPYALALRWVEATPLSRITTTHLSGEIFDRLDAILAALHARGVALGDLHHRDVLVDPRGDVHVVDLATAWRSGRGIRGWVFGRLSLQDRLAAARLRARFTGVPEEEALAGVPEEARRWHARGRLLKRAFDKVRGRRR